MAVSKQKSHTQKKIETQKVKKSSKTGMAGWLAVSQALMVNKGCT